MIRQLRVRIDRASWTPPQTPPADLTALGTRNTINILHALIHTALWTRPPTVKGFHLADYWAWIRYGRAFASTADLRLCEDWEDLDPHQKTILSDEFGIGVTTCLLAQGLNCTRFVDTLFVLRSLLPDRFYQRRTSKVGASKSPDFIATDSLGRFLVLECKGTQSSSATLRRAMQNGVAQKRNLRPRRGTQVYMSLVGGLFVPQWSSRETAAVVFSDPSWEELSEALESLAPEQVAAGVAQMHTAKMLAVAGLTRAADDLSRSALSQLRTLSDDARRELDAVADDQDFTSQVVDTTDSRIPGLPRVRFSIRIPPAIAETLIRARDLREALPILAEQHPQRRWRHDTNQDGVVEVSTPDGYVASLLYLDDRNNNAAPAPAPVRRG